MGLRLELDIGNNTAPLPKMRTPVEHTNARQNTYRKTPYVNNKLVFALVTTGMRKETQTHTQSC